MIQLISVPTDLFQVHRSLLWVAGEQDRNVCVVKGKSEESCQNYVKENVPPLPSSPPRQVNIILPQTGKFVAAKFSHLLLL